MQLIADKIRNDIKPSLTLLIDAKAQSLKAQGHDIISLGVGELDFDTPDNIKEAAINAIKSGYTKYTPAGGIKQLKEAVITKMQRDNNLSYNLEEICVSSGAKQVIYNCLVASLNPNEEVIIVSPYWVSYPEMIKIAGGVPIVAKMDKKTNFCLDIDKIEQSITPRTKWIIINSPNNPSGIVYSYQELEALAKLLMQPKYQHVNILSDDIYEYFTYDQHKFYNILSIEKRLKDRCLIVNGVSKSYAMTGWRIGYGAGPALLIKAMMTVQSQSTSGACSISQFAALEALNGEQSFITLCKQTFLRRRDIVTKYLNQTFGINCLTPAGAFYVFADCSALFNLKTKDGKTIHNSSDVAQYLLEESHVAVVPGDSFGEDGFLRISYATNEKILEEACIRIKKACELLAPKN